MDSSKRALYKPAPIENVGAKQNRSLAQGRLVNDAFIPDSLTVYASPPSVEMTSIDTLTTISHSASQFNSGSLSPAHQSLASLNLSHQTPSLSSDLSSPLPRRGSPSHQYMAERNSSPPHSPLKPSPTNILELSDSDREYVSHHRTPIRHIPSATGSPVLLVDASGQHLDSGQAEVEVRTRSVKSPAKIVCHAPTVVDNELRNRGYTEEAARVRVDSVPSVTVLGDVDLRRGTSADRSEPPQAGDPTHTSRESTVVPQELTASSTLSSNTESTLTGTLKANETSPQQGPSDVGYEGNASLESERPSSSLSVADDSKAGSTKKKKKVKGKFVQSRYMQSLSKPAPTQASNISATSRTNRSASRPTSSKAVSRTDRKKTSTKPAPIQATVSFSQASTAPSSGHPKARSSSHSRPPASATATGSGASQFNYTPVAKKGKRFASTPAANTSVLPNAPSINASAIAASTSMMTGGDMSAIAPAAVSELGGPHSSVSLSPTHDSAYSSLGNKPANEPTQEDLSVMYARYLQAAFLDTKMRKVIADKEKEAKNQMFALWKENEELAKKRAQLELRLARLKHANELDQQLLVQEQGLGPLTSHLAQFKQEYSTLAHALDTTRHQVELTDILVPDDQDEFNDRLERELAESEALLGEIAAVTRTKQPKVEALSRAISMLESSVAQESAELLRCQELVAAASSLSNHETSMRIQQLEQRLEE